MSDKEPASQALIDAIARYQKDYGVNLRPLFTNPELRKLLDSAE